VKKHHRREGEKWKTGNHATERTRGKRTSGHLKDKSASPPGREKGCEKTFDWGEQKKGNTKSSHLKGVLRGLSKKRTRRKPHSGGKVSYSLWGE